MPRPKPTPEVLGRHRWKPRCKLTDLEAQEIRDSTDRHHLIAARYGVAQSTVTRIKNGTRRQIGGDIAEMA